MIIMVIGNFKLVKLTSVLIMLTLIIILWKILLLSTAFGPILCEYSELKSPSDGLNWRFKRECGSAFKFTNCEQSYITNKQFLIKTKYECGYDRADITWEIKDKEHMDVEPKIYDNYNKFVFTLSPHSLSFGTYVITVTATIYKGKVQVDSLKAICEIRMLSQTPVPYITGGSKRYVRPGADVTVDASSSRYLVSDTINVQQKLVYHWQCHRGNSESDPDCDSFNPGSGPNITLPATYMSVGNSYFITVSLNHEVNKASQIIQVLQQAMEFSIICRKNCPPISTLTNPKEETYLKAICDRNCGTGSRNYQWMVETEGGTDFDMEKNTLNGGHNQQLVIKSDGFINGETYTIRIIVNSKPAAEYNLEIRQAVKIESCSVKPQTGYAGKTEYQVSCITLPKQGVYSYEIIAQIENTDIHLHLDNSGNLNGMPVMLPVSAMYYVKIIDQYFNYDVKKLDVQVMRRLSGSDVTPNTVQREANEAISKFRELVKVGDVGKAVQVASSMTAELAALHDIDYREIKQSYKMSLLEAMTKEMKIDAYDSGSQAAALISQALDVDKDDTEPGFAAVASDMCLNISSQQYRYLNASVMPLQNSDDIRKDTELGLLI